jgi:glucose-6-phosphate-specific signal transduction histidine kinase
LKKVVGGFFSGRFSGFFFLWDAMDVLIILVLAIFDQFSLSLSLSVISLFCLSLPRISLSLSFSQENNLVGLK